MKDFNEGNVTRKHIYVDLDSIYDTRFTLLSLMNPTHALNVLKGDYIARTSDSFGHLTYNVFNHIYRDRDNEVLRLSKLTHMCEMIAGTMTDLNYEDLLLGGVGDVKLFVNVYPYDLNDGEIEILREALLIYVKDANNIIIMREENIDPKWIDKRISVIMMYNGLEWLWDNISNGRLSTASLIDTNMVIPNLFPTDEKMEEDEVLKIYDTFSPIVNLAIIDTYHFCIKPIKKKTVDKQES